MCASGAKILLSTSTIFNNQVLFSNATDSGGAIAIDSGTLTIVSTIPQLFIIIILILITIATVSPNQLSLSLCFEYIFYSFVFFLP